MAKAAESAGILMYRRSACGIEVLLVHPDGPFWKRRDAGAWTIPKGEVEPGEAIDYAARREFAEELGVVPTGALLALGAIRQKAGKLVHGFAMEGDFDLSRFASNVFEMEWPPKSGRLAEFPEVDRAEWLPVAAAREKINPGQIPFLDRLADLAAG
jgi:predicted NUDIX family NTP pyrophosphohydrolase